MFNLLKIFNFGKKFVPRVIEDQVAKPVTAETYAYLQDLMKKLQEVEGRLDHVEAYGCEKLDRSINRKNKSYDDKVSRFSDIEREYINLYIDRLIVKISSNYFDVSLKTKDFPWNPGGNKLTEARKEWLWVFRCYFLQDALEEMYKLRRKSFKIVENSEKNKYSEENK
tara:strand:+ start:2156 stop:2659 length:504 start_codon:yes stop_codon:yes gene_type:complete